MGVVQTVRHGLTWRGKRLQQRMAKPQRAKSVSKATTARRTGSVEMAATESLAAANDALRMIGADNKLIATKVKGRHISVAVIVPTYADSLFLGDALRSVQQQSFTNWRCYVVDDASPDDVDSVFNEFRSDSRFVLLRHGANAGLAAARNTGIRVCTEDAIQFLDADDLLTPWSLSDRVDDLRTYWNDPLIAGVHGQVLQCTEETELRDVSSWTAKPNPGRRDWMSTEGESPFTVHAPLTKSSVIKSLGGFDESFLNGAEDWDFWQRVLRHGFAFNATKSVAGAYRQRKASMIREHGSIHLARADALFEASSQWAEVDESVAVSNARMPISEARAAYQRLIRAARWAGIRAAQLKSVDEAINDEILSFLHPDATVGTRRDDCFRSARGGVIRGLGLSTNIIDELSSDAREVITQTAWEITDQLLEHCAAANGPTGTLRLDRRQTTDVALIAETNADAAALVALAKTLETEGFSVRMVDAESVLGESGAAASFADHGIDSVSYNQVALGSVACGVLLARSPASPGVLNLFARAEELGARPVLLADPTRELLLEDSPSFEPGYPVVEATHILDVIHGEERSHEQRPAPTTDFSILLPAEEHALDAAGYEWMMDMKDSKQGESVVVIGNGPSLNDTNLDLLAGTDTFGVNSIFLADEKLPEPLTYYVVEDTAVFKDNTEAIKAYPAVHKLFPTMYLPRFSEDNVPDNTHFFRMNLGFYGRTTPEGTSTGTFCHPRFSTNAAQRSYCGQSVTIVNLQLAYWFGYSRIVLIGMDFSYQIPDDAERNGNLIVSRSDDPNHFHPDYFGAGKTWKDPKLDRVMVNYRLAKEIYEADGREIVNSTVGGKLGLFPRLTLAEALNK